MGAISGAFACMYFDAQRPMTLTILGTYMTVVVVGAVVPSSVYLPGFYLLVLSAHVPYLGLLLYTGGTEHLVVAGINILFLVVVFSYAHAANRMQREAMRLRYENQRLIGDLEVRKAEAESASRTKSLFLAGVSHDLKQPIRAIGLYTGYLRHSAAQDNAPASVVIQTAEKIETATAAVHGQITRLLELSRLESGAAPVHRVPLRLDEGIARAVELMLPEAQARGVTVHCRVVGKVMLESDIRMLDSILTNLLGNAIKHAQATRVLVAVRHQRTGVRLDIRDNGVGIPPERLPQLFEAYRSFDDRQASDSHGLGLAIVRAQAGYLGAQITVRSAPGQGSVFALEGLG
jgi:signal transduction histidine kinase